MIVRAPTYRPVKLAVARSDRHVIDASDSQAHQPVHVELPVFVAVGAIPVSFVVVPLVRKPNGDTISFIRPDFFDEPVLQFQGPLARQKRPDGVAAFKKFRPGYRQRLRSYRRVRL